MAGSVRQSAPRLGRAGPAGASRGECGHQRAQLPRRTGEQSEQREGGCWVTFWRKEGFLMGANLPRISEQWVYGVEVPSGSVQLDSTAWFGWLAAETTTR